MVLVRVRQDDRVDPPVPRRDPLVEDDEEPVRVGAAVDEEPAAARALDEDRVALPDIEHAHPRDAGRSADDHRAGHDDRDDERQGRRASAGGTTTARRIAPLVVSARGAVVPRQARALRGGPAIGRATSGDGHERRDRRDRGDRSRQGHARERQRRHRVDDRDHDPQRDPSRSREDAPDQRRCARRAPGSRRASRPARPPSPERRAARPRG